jgi:hypothetical protein
MTSRQARTAPLARPKLDKHSSMDSFAVLEDGEAEGQFRGDSSDRPARAFPTVCETLDPQF